MYGQILDPTLVWLCGTCHDNVHAWIYWLTGERRRPVPDPPPRARDMARQVHDWYTTALPDPSPPSPAPTH